MWLLRISSFRIIATLLNLALKVKGLPELNYIVHGTTDSFQVLIVIQRNFYHPNYMLTWVDRTEIPRVIYSAYDAVTLNSNDKKQAVGV